MQMSSGTEESFRRLRLLEDRTRAAYMEELYYNDMRHEREHPMHGLYTGLLEQRKEQLIEWDRTCTVPNFYK